MPNKKYSSFLHRAGSTSYNIETAFEVRVRMQSLCAAESTSDDTNASSSSFAVQQHSVWATKEAGACVLSAVLLKLTPQHVETVAKRL